MKHLSLAIVVLVVFAVSGFAQTEKEPPLITVSGQAEVRVPPDEVLFTLEVESTDKDMLAAKNRTDESVKQVFAIARRLGVKSEDVQTSYISVEPRYTTDDLEYEQRRVVKREFIGYRVSKTTAVRLRDITKFDAMLSEVLKAGVTRVRNMEFRNSELRKHRDRARQLAIKAAQEKARLLAGEIGQSIGPAYSISEAAAAPYSRAANQNFTIAISADMADSESSAIAPGLISVSAQVTVSFRLL